MSDLTTMVFDARQRMIERWLLDPQVNQPPNDMTFKEIHVVLDKIVRRVALCRVMYPWSKPKDTTDAIIRSLPPHLRSSQRDVEPVVQERTLETAYDERPSHECNDTCTFQGCPAPASDSKSERSHAAVDKRLGI